jgi:HD-like signal output (HDOD) protein
MSDNSSQQTEDTVEPTKNANDKTDSKDPDKKERLHKRVNQIDDLPSLPVVVQKVNEIMELQGVTVQEVGKVLQTEPSLVAKVLKLVNSAYFGLNRRINSLPDAVVYLGFETIRNIVLNATVMEMTDTTEETHRFEEYDFTWSGFWKKSVATGIATETVAREIEIPGHQAATPAGTLHMLGILVLRTKFPDDFETILKLTRTKDLGYFEAEKAVLGTRSVTIGKWLSERWELPEQTVSGIAHWTEPLNAHEDKQLIPLLVHTGERLARARGVGWNPVDTVGLSKAIISELDIAPNQFEKIMETYRQDLQDAHLFMELCEEIK